MIRVYHRYELWEDFAHGLYRMALFQSPQEQERLIELSRALLADQPRLWDAMSSVTLEWIYATEVQITNTTRNRRAWLGQAACCFAHGAPESLTKLAWHRLEEVQQDRANAVADRVISTWEANYYPRGSLFCA